MIALEPISASSAPVFRAVRLAALRDSPTAFGSTYAEELQLADAQWLSRASRCAGPGCIGLLAIDAGSACGIVRCTVDEQDAGVAWVESMWVAPERRKRGVGRQLMDAILDWARGRGIGGLKLSVTSNNAAAIRFYQGVGFRPTGKTEPYPNDPALVECELWLRLS